MATTNQEKQTIWEEGVSTTPLDPSHEETSRQPKVNEKMQGKRKRGGEYLATAPSLLWLTILLIIPTFLVLTFAFKTADPYGGIGSDWTLASLRSLGNPSYPAIIWRTIWQSVATTLICVALSIPMGYFMARTSEKVRRLLMVLTILPFWICFILRVFAWMSLLHPDGFIKEALVFLHLAAPHEQLLYTSGAVLLVMVYNHLPFAILPIYAASEKFDFQLLEAAADLGATRFRAFRSVFIPGIKTGIAAAVLMVLIPALGEYVIPDMVGGPNSEMIGNKIAQRVQNDRNLPHACALSAALMLFVLGPMLAVMIGRRRQDRAASTTSKPNIGGAMLS